MTQSGFWEPHTSSVDFCEPDYLVSHYIAETHNVWSSLIISLLGIIGIIFCNPSGELRVYAMFSLLTIVGFGSAALHGTLHWLFQSADEVPMLWGNIAFLFNLYNMDSKQGESTAVSALFITAVGAVQTYIYFEMRHLYWIFLLQYISFVAIVVLWTAYKVFTSEKNEYPIRYFLLTRAVFSFVVIATMLWVYEMNNCDTLLPYFTAFFGLSFHILWHIGAGLGTYLHILLLVVFRYQSQGYNCQLDWRKVKFVPVLLVGEKTDKSK